MKIIFCNITPMNRYEGATEKDKITKGAGAWVKENLDAHEKWNFLNQNGKCYGFVQNKDGVFHIERMERVSHAEDYTDNVTVIWCAPKSDGTTVIVGWYEKARVYRYYQTGVFTLLTGIDRSYFTEAKAEDCYLLPLEERTYVIPRASKDGAGKGFGQSNFYYAESEYAKDVLVPGVMSYIEAHRKGRINHMSSEYLPLEHYDDVFTQEEADLADEYEATMNYEALLPLSYKLYFGLGKEDEAYWIATCLTELHQYDEAIKWYKKMIEYEGDEIDTLMYLGALYFQTGAIEDARDTLEKVQMMESLGEDQQNKVLLPMLADVYHVCGDFEKGVTTLNRIMAVSKDVEYIEYLRETKKIWLEEASNH